LANLFMHNAFDVWMKRYFLSVQFERYADDAIVHCMSEVQARNVLRAISSSSWSELMRRVFAIDVLACPHCPHLIRRRWLTALITDLFVARRILEHLGLPGQAPALAAARPPPQMAFGF
jgi:hypothetical protein